MVDTVDAISEEIETDTRADVVTGTGHEISIVIEGDDLSLLDDIVPAYAYVMYQYKVTRYKSEKANNAYTHLVLALKRSEHPNGEIWHIDRRFFLGQICEISDWWNDHALILDEGNVDGVLLDYWMNDGYSAYQKYPGYQDALRQLRLYSGGNGFIGNNPSQELIFTPPKNVLVEEPCGAPMSENIESVEEAYRYAMDDGVVRDDLEWWIWYQKEIHDKDRDPWKWGYAQMKQRQAYLDSRARRQPKYYKGAPWSGA